MKFVIRTEELDWRNEVVLTDTEYEDKSDINPSILLDVIRTGDFDIRALKKPYSTEWECTNAINQRHVLPVHSSLIEIVFIIGEYIESLGVQFVVKTRNTANGVITPTWIKTDHDLLKDEGFLKRISGNAK